MTRLEDLSIQIIGAGAIGTYTASLLMKALVPHKLLSRPSTHIDQKNDIQFPNDILSCNKTPVSSVTEDADFVFLATKAYDLIQAYESISHLIKRDTVIVILANGYYLKELEPTIKKSNSKNWRLGICTTGVKLSSDHLYMTQDSGQIIWGPYNRETKEFTENELNLCARVNKFKLNLEIRSSLAKKFLFNCTINTICGALKLSKNLDLLDHIPLVKLVYDESLKLTNQVYGSPTFDAEATYSEMIQLIKNTGENENSMAADIRLKKKTEIGYLSGLANPAELYPQLTFLNHKILENLSKQPKNA